MVFSENVQLALHSLKANPLRSVLTLIGIAVGIGAVLYVVVLGEITQQSINERLESLGSNVLLIRPGYSRRHGVRTGASVGTMVAYLTGWSLWAVSRLPMEIGILGWRFVVARLAATFIFPPIAGLIAQTLFSSFK